MRIHKSFAPFRTPSFFLFLLGTLLSLFCSPRGNAQAFLDTQFEIGGSTLAAPSGVAADSTGNIYVADSGNNRIVKIPVTSSGFGTAETILDNLSHPGGLVLDWTGNLYIADSGNNRIVELPVASGGYGAPTTIATGLNAPGGLTLDPAGNLYVADTGNNRIVKLPALGSSFGAPAAIGSGFSAPGGIAMDPARNLYIADTGNNRIVKLTYASGYTTAQFLFSNVVSPAGIAVDASYNLFIASSSGHRVVEEPWGAGAGRYNTNIILGSGWNTPVAVVPDSHGNVFIVDNTATQLWEIPIATHSFSTTPVGSAGSSQIYNFTIPAGASIGGSGVLTQGSTGLDFSEGQGSTCIAQTFASATICSIAVQFTPTVSGIRKGAVVLYDSEGNTLVTAYLQGTGIAPTAAFLPAQQIAMGTQLSGPSGIAVDGAGNIYIADTGNNRIVEIPCANGVYGAQFTLPVNQLSAPMGLTIDGAGNLYITSSGNDKIVELPHASTGFGPQFKVPIAVYVPTSVTVDAGGTLYIADTYENRVVKLIWNGTGYNSPHMIGNYVKMPMGVGVDNAGNAFFSMPYQNDLIEIPWASGQYQPQRIVSNSQVSFPTSIVTDGNGNVYLLDSGNNRVLMYPATAAGPGSPITVASGFNAPIGMAIDAGNNLYVADSGNNRIVRINLSQPAPHSFLSTYVSTTSQDSAQYTTVQNTGNVNASVVSVAYPSDFPENGSATSACASGAALSPGSGCTLAINFTPQAVGSLSESVSLTLTQLESEQSISVAVSGAARPLSSQSINFPSIGAVPYGSPAIKLSATATSGLPVTFQVVSGPATLASNGYVLNLTGTGTVVIAAGQSGSAIYQAAHAVTMSFTVTPATLTVTPNKATATYGAIPTAFGYTLSGFIQGQTANQVVSGAPAITVDAGLKAGVGAHALLATLGTLKAANYNFAFVPGVLTVNPAVLQIAAAPASMNYGGTLPRFTWTATGFVNGDSASALYGAPDFATPASPRSPAGAYSITPMAGTLAASNYTFTFTGATLTVTPAALTIVAESQAMVYGSPLPNLAYTIQGLQGADTASVLAGAPQLTTTAGPKSKVGSYALVPSLGSLKASNYNVTFVSGTITVVPAQLTVSPAAVTIAYGQSIPALKSLQLVGLVNGDTAATALTGTPVLSTTATAGTPPGNAPITIQPGTVTSSNYTVDLQPGTLVITPAVLKVTPASASRPYGAANPTISFTITGFVNGDTAATALTGAPAFTTAATAASAAGSYPVTATAGTLSAACYTFSYASASITVTKAQLTVTANPLSISYGTATPQLTYTITGFQNGDTAASLTGSPILSTTAASTPSAGSYPISIDTSSLASPNYTFTKVPSMLTVSKAAATVTANNQSTTTGGTLPTLTYTVSGLVNGDQAAGAITGAPSLSTSATSSSAAGSYSIVIANGTMAASNYALSLVNGTLTLTQPITTVTNPNPITPRLPNRKIP
jgi:sugar lactone lactonase YvrE